MESDSDGGFLKLSRTYEWVSGDNSAPVNKKAIAKVAFSCFYYIDPDALCLLLKPTTLHPPTPKKYKKFPSWNFCFVYYLSIVQFQLFLIYICNYRRCRMIVKEGRN